MNYLALYLLVAVAFACHTSERIGDSVDCEKCPTGTCEADADRCECPLNRLGIYCDVDRLTMEN
jgi:hypothetical protein